MNVKQSKISEGLRINNDKQRMDITRTKKRIFDE